MEQVTNNNEIVTVLPEDIGMYDYDNLIAVADRAERMVQALNKMMLAAIKITSGLDWTVIGGHPYLQESGATKVARLFGIGWKILDTKRTVDRDGYPTYEYRMEFRMGNNVIECDGSRDGAGEFFTGKDKAKGPDEISDANVKKAAYTNCLNNGIKRLLPGLRNIDLKVLEDQGIKPGSGYTFKEGRKGGGGRAAANEGLVCSACDAKITQAEASYSEGRMGRRLCRSCQKNPPPAQDAPDDVPPPPEPPPERQ